MKGVIDIEFVLSVIVFLSVISFVSYLIISNIPVFRSESFSEDRRGVAYQISQLLLFDKGEPSNWNPDNVKRIGLSSGENYILDNVKINHLDTICKRSNGYQKLRELLTLDRTDVRIEIISSAGALASCSPPVSTTRPEFQITRFAVMDIGNERLKIQVSVI